MSIWSVRELWFAIAAALALAGSLAAGAGGLDSVATASALLALGLGGATFVPGAVRGAVAGRLGVGLLMTIAAVGAVLLGELTEAAMLAVLFSGSEALEEFSLARARHGLRSLLSLIPDEVRIKRDGADQTVPADEVAVGDVLVVRPGERVATDGTVSAGSSSLDLSAITGESIPVGAAVGDQVPAGAVNGPGVLEVAASAAIAENSLARIVAVVQTEQARKGSAQRLADRIARPMVPAILLAGLLVAAVGSLFGDPAVWIERALVVVVAASPCALAISVPVTSIAAIGAATRLGALIKGSAALEELAGVNVIALDKTGTITANRPTVVEVLAVDGASRSQVTGVAAALEARSEHPLAAAIVDAADPARPADEVEAVVGSGVAGRVGGRSARIGRPGWVPLGPLSAAAEQLEAAGATVVAVEQDGVLLGVIGIRDEPRPEARTVTGDLRSRGIEPVMLTGDNPRTAASVARAISIDEAHADLRPTGKADLIRGLRRTNRVAMVGDGINDAPALAAADVGIAMAARGTDVAIEAADIALMGEDLRHLPRLVDHARGSNRIMRQNLALSLTIIVALVPLATAGVLGLAAVVAIHEIAEMVVIANGVRAGRTSKLPALTPIAVPQSQPVLVTLGRPA
jgi:cation-transporting ATPase G